MLALAVGGGSAGSVVANRLSEDPSVKVLLLEAGGKENMATEIPLLAPLNQMTPLDWQYRTTPQARSCLGIDERRCTVPRGKVLGGGSTLNFMLYVRGNRRDYDIWEQMGNYGWGYDNVLEYFKKSEDQRVPELAANTQYHGRWCSINI